MSKKIKVRTLCEKTESFEYIIEVDDCFDEQEWANKVNKKVANWDNSNWLSKKDVLSSSLNNILDVKKVGDREFAKITSINDRRIEKEL